MSCLPVLSCDALIVLVKKEAAILSGNRGSVPQDVNAKLHYSSSAGHDDSQSNSDSPSSDSSSSSDEIGKDSDAVSGG